MGSFQWKFVEYKGQIGFVFNFFALAGGMNCAVLNTSKVDRRATRRELLQSPWRHIVTEYRPNSHADVVVGKYLEGYRQDGRPPKPRSSIVSLYTAQVPPN